MLDILKPVFRLFLFVGVAIFLSSSACTCEYGADGFVYDKNSGETLDSVLVTGVFGESNRIQEEYTLYGGHYSIGSGGWPCQEIRILFQKEGYVTQHLFVPKGEIMDNHHIHLVKKD